MQRPANGSMSVFRWWRECTYLYNAFEGMPSHYLYMIWLSLTNTVSDNKIQISILILRRIALSNAIEVGIEIDDD